MPLDSSSSPRPQQQPGRPGRPPGVACRRPARGFTLIESVVAMAIMLVGSLGLLALHGMGVRMNADARVMTRATAIGQDLVSQLQLWSYADPRLANSVTSNDAGQAYADPGATFETDAFVFDHQEPELEGQDQTLFPWNGIPSAAVQGLGFTRYWNVAEVDDVNGFGTPDAKRVAVIVRWVQDGGPRRLVLLTTLANPGNIQ